MKVDSNHPPPSPVMMFMLFFMILTISIFTSSPSLSSSSSSSLSASSSSCFPYVPVAYASSSPSSWLPSIKRRRSNLKKNKLAFYVSKRGGGGGGNDDDNNNTSNDILVVGSLNADTFLPVSRLPTEGENVCIPSNVKPTIDVPGGKGCTQAIACSSLLSNNKQSVVCFLGQFGNDNAASILKEALQTSNVQLSNYCTTCVNVPSGRGYVFRSIVDGTVSAVVSGGSNLLGWAGWRHLISTNGDDDYKELQQPSSEEEEGEIMTQSNLHQLFENKSCILLQREIPEFVNEIILREAKKYNKDIIILQDVGGDDRPIKSTTLQYCDYVIPNQSELKRLVHSFLQQEEGENTVQDGDDDGTEEEQVIKYANILQKYGANNVLVTLGSKGSILVPAANGDKDVIYQKACALPPNTSIVDETGAGDCYRAAFAVALSEKNKTLRECMKFASAAGALAVTKEGAVPSVPSRAEVEELYGAEFGDESVVVEEGIMDEEVHVLDGSTMIAEDSVATSLARGGGSTTVDDDDDDDVCPLLFGSRLNSMKDRPDLSSSPIHDVRDWVKRQGTINGLNCVDFNYPQHFHSWTNEEAKQALDDENLVAGAVCLRYPSKFARGAMIHPDPAMRREAIEITKEAARTARELGCDEVVVWSAYDGYDYPFQVNYDEKWDQIVDAFRECCDAFPDIKFSLEFKPTDENTRFFTVPSTGAALLLVKEIDRPNMGLTLDVGHMLMAGENPGQSIAMVGREKKLFGVQLNDGYTRLAAEDGMMFGSIHPSMALEVIYQLRKTGYKGHFYFDTFPQRTDPVKEAEYNIQRVKKFWKAAGKLDEMGLQEVMDNHDALAALDITNKVI
mmetsp:Transcript_27986/g.41272  ORF Transcript_27986/g.41272 Transcript_27986/m.41272 type:complete len:847 (-) Transcript_27986:106-2646(-)